MNTLLNHSGYKISTLVENTADLPDHPVLGVVDPEEHYYVHCIPKNASSYIRSVLNEDNWKELQSIDRLMGRTYPVTGLCFIRDPMDRWISGITEFLYNVYKNPSDVFNYWEGIFKIIAANPCMDSHTAAQSKFLQKIDLQIFDFIKLEDFDTNKKRIRAWASRNGIELSGLDIVHLANATQNSDRKKEISQFLRECLKNNQDIQKNIIEYYRVDYTLTNWITANNKWIQ